MDNFKIIPVSSALNFSTERQAKLEVLFGNFPATDIRFNWVEEKFDVMLNALDFRQFKKTITNYAENVEPDAELKKFSLRILDAVDSIRSYGLKSKKRVYFGYNDERKVKGRAKKVSNRQPYFYAANHNHSETNQPCPAQYKNKIVCGDSEDVLKNLPDTHTVDQDHLDAFKLLCWIGCAIINGLDKDISYHQHETVLDALIKSLEEILAMETKFEVALSEKDRTLLKRFVMQEIKGNSDHGIGFNGLFVAFHCFRSTYRQLKKAA